MEKQLFFRMDFAFMVGYIKKKSGKAERLMKRPLLYLLWVCLLAAASCSPEEERIPAASYAQQAKPAALPEDRFLTIAHRGASAYLPEHTLPAYALAVEMGADYIELDLRMTKDGRLAVIHDNDLERIGGTGGQVSDKTMDELKNVSPGPAFNEENPELAQTSHEQLSIPELRDVLIRFGTAVNYYIELKAPPEGGGMEKAVIGELERYGITEKAGQHDLPPVILQSFSEESLIRLHKMRREIPLIQLYSFKDNADLSSEDLEYLQSYASGIGIPAASAHAGFIEKVEGWELDVHVFTVNEEQDILRLIRMGADGVFTDRPDVARRVSSYE
jgi:glycerophosphoryl diester phosphodiesterase